MKDTFYFQHDYNAANDQKILRLRAKFNNAEGYGVYFMILEAMAQEENGCLDNDCIAQLSLSYGLAIEQLKAVINYCVEIGLFILYDGGLYSKRMIEHKNFRRERSLSGKRGAKTRWENSSAIAQPMAQPMQRKGKERKEKKNKGNNIIPKHKYSTFEELKNIEEKDIQELVDRYGGNPAFVRSCIENMENWLAKNGKPGKYGKPYKNYLAALRDFVKRDALKIKQENHDKRFSKSKIAFIKVDE